MSSKRRPGGDRRYEGARKAKGARQRPEAAPRLEHHVDGLALPGSATPLLVREAWAALQAREERFRALVENGTDGIALVKADGRVIYVSPSITEILGYAPAGLRGRSGFAFIHPEDRTPARALIASSITQPGVPLPLELRGRHKDGSWRDLELVVVNRLGDPSVAGVVANFRDITRRKQVEASLRRLASIVESSEDAIVGKTLDGVITSWNRGAERLYGYTSEEAIGRSITMLAPRGRKRETRAVLDRVALGDRIDPYETVLVRKDGRAIHVSLTFSPILERGRVVGASAIARDVTARKRDDEARRASGERYRTLMEQANDAILVCDATGRILEANRRAEELLSRPRALLVGLAYADVSPEERAHAAHDRERLVVEGALDVQRRQMLRADGSRVSVEVSGALVDVPEGPLAFVTIRDITERTRAEEALRRGAEKLKSVLDGALDAVIGMDERGLISSWNTRAEAIFGWTAQEAVGRSVADLLIPAGQREAHTKGLERFLATGQGPLIGRRVEVTALHRRGSEFPIELSVVAVADAGGTAFTAFIADITERRRAQEALEQLRRRYELILNSIADGVHGIDLQGRITFENPAAARMLGWDVAELAGLPAHETIHHSWADGIARPKGECPILATVTDAVLRPVKEDVFWRKDGTSFPVEYLVAPKLDADGRGAGAVVTFRDITERKEAERRLTESEAQYRRLFDSNAQPMWVFDEETLAFLAVNAAAILHYGWSHEEFLGLRLTDLRPPEEVPQLLAVLAEARGQNAFFKFGNASALRHRKKDGTLIDVEGVASRIVFAGRPAWLSLVSDVTERKRLEAQVLHSQKMDSIGRLAGGVAHDFNNILGVIVGSADLLRRRLPDDPRAHKYVDDLQKAAQRGAGLTRQLLAFSRRQVLQPRVVSLNDVAGEMEQMLRRLIGEDVQLVTVFDDSVAPVRADPGQIEQVLMNLVVNARDAMPRGGRIVIETGTVWLDEDYAACHAGVAPGRYSMLLVSDSGHGMSPQVQAHLFEPFFTTKEKGKGTGLGLATVHGIVKQSGGDVFVYSEPGHGSTFKVFLPAVDEPSGKAELSPVEETHLARGSETVLLVEDEEALSGILQERLEESGYSVLTAPDGIAALALCERREGPIDLLLTDVILPRMGGSELARRLAERRPQMKVLYMSGYTDDAVILHGVLTEQTAFLEKPFTANSLLRKIREVLDQPPAVPEVESE